MNELSALVRFLHLTATVLLAGGFSFLVFIAGPAFARLGLKTNSIAIIFLQWQMRHARWCLMVLAVTAVIRLWLQAVNVSETASGSYLDASALISLVTETQFGNVWLGRMVLQILFAALLALAATGSIEKNSRWFPAVGLALSIGLLVSLALAGHAAAAEGAAFGLQVSSDALHLLACGIWLGGLVPLALLLSECHQSGDASAATIAEEVTRRFSATALIGVSILIATGVYNAWILVGSLPPLFGTPYGELLLIKLGLLLPLLAVGAVNLLKLKPKLRVTSLNRLSERFTLVQKLRRNVIIETSLGIAILLIVGHMGVTPPARHVQPDWPFSFRWDWSSLEKAPKVRAEIERGVIWTAIGSAALLTAFLRRRRRIVSAAVGIAALGYAVAIIDAAVSIDAYPATYKRTAVAYQAISVANGKTLYEDSGCVTCHGPNGYGDGPTSQDLTPKPADLTAPHANAHTAGDLFGWLSYGVKQASAMPGFGQSLSEEEQWDLINYLRALSSGERARNLAPVIEDIPWLVAPDFTYGTNTGETRTLKDHRGSKIVLLILLNLEATEKRLQQLANTLPQLQSAGLEVIVVPNLIDYLYVANKLPGLIVNEGIREISETYKLFARSFTDENLLTGTPHVEFLIDKQGYIRARWLAAEGEAWSEIAGLMSQVELLRKEKPRAAAPDDHVH